MNHKKHLKELRAKTRSAPDEEPEFQIAPMIDILLVLLVFFMSISTTEILQTRKDVILPVAKEGTAKVKGDGEGELTVNIVWSDLNPTQPGTIYVDDAAISPDQLASRVDVKLKSKPLLRVVIRADRQVKFDFLKTVMKSVLQAGVANVTFAVTNKDANALAAPAQP